MQQKITGFHQDFENHWVAELACGHGQHVRHDPPFMPREWVVTAQGRETHLGRELNCVRCDEIVHRLVPALLAAVKKDLQEGYADAGISGLCDEGRWEAALGRLQVRSLEAAVFVALKVE